MAQKAPAAATLGESSVAQSVALGHQKAQQYRAHAWAGDRALNMLVGLMGIRAGLSNEQMHNKR